MLLTRNDFIALGLAVVVFSVVYYLLALNGTFLSGWAVWAFSIVVSWSVLANRFVRTRAWKEAPSAGVVSARARKRRARKQRYRGEES